MLDSSNYAVGWICAIAAEYVAAQVVLDERMNVQLLGHLMIRTTTHWSSLTTALRPFSAAHDQLTIESLIELLREAEIAGTSVVIAHLQLLRLRTRILHSL